ncbi:PTS sugar transporter subunit IIA [Kluyvera ascorbata]|jgi:Phosphotransferase system mannitol/fructose-specific IIA domain (Ntr-type)|uniref:PTS sugar transporter subunit IIA n=1 Tax=Kluyvera ascorbata TaxID=51288 RepID=A0A3N2RZL3_9ENTR|nr:PTS sugar transporter subunit IIA [Kluyvera ascorbata]BBV68281.1 PTS galactitol transporter subunit IIA [Klebsiella sp. STW0522-44]MDU3913034.1 PTS sugar transporter subunit IIA [Kluyvera ascorbata]MDZ4034106.1 PTS sugar transporter subunit IIA [Kluyvera ascorbata]MEB6390510.1 PTS sugar transporter subunit IIA [Kluyvera ascorbata]ROU12718.1 PTS sugar transporter subunit IIA [Kluyvera ascorbata]
MRTDIIDAPHKSAQGCEYFTPQLTFLDKHYNNSTDFFSSIFLLLKKQGYVQDSFLDAIIAREKAYPTALPTLPVAIALPHTDPQHIIRPFISVTRLSTPIAWQEMGNDDNTLYVHFIVLLGFVDHSSHLTALQKLMDCLADEEVVQTLREIDDVETFLCTLTSRLQLDKDL